jgi:hypothetical protein
MKARLENRGYSLAFFKPETHHTMEKTRLHKSYKTISFVVYTVLTLDLFLYIAQIETFVCFLQCGPKYWLTGYWCLVFPPSYLKRSHTKKNQRGIINAISSSR